MNTGIKLFTLILSLVAVILPAHATKSPTVIASCEKKVKPHSKFACYTNITRHDMTVLVHNTGIHSFRLCESGKSCDTFFSAPAERTVRPGASNSYRLQAGKTLKFARAEKYLSSRTLKGEVMFLKFGV